MLLNLFRCLGDSTYTRCQCTLYGWQYKDIELLCTSIKGLEAHIEKTEESLKWLFVCVCAFGYLMELFIMLNLYIEEHLGGCSPAIGYDNEIFSNSEHWDREVSMSGNWPGLN